jgi:uncharacterized protein
MKLLHMFLTLCLCLPATAMATYIEPDPLRNEFSSVAAADAEAAKKFDVRFALSTHHANERYRLYAQTAAADGRLNDAAKFFRIAATYADKYSQLRLSMLYWHGVGVPQDLVEAYIWADLAAERGYPKFLAVREQMWRELTPEQQASAELRGPALYAEFGDAVAKQRFHSKLARSATRAHAKRIGGIQVRPGKWLRGGVPSREEEEAWSLAYSPSRVDPEIYWAIEDRIMTRGLSSTVTVGEIEETARVKPEYYQFKFKPRTPEQPKREEPEQEQPEQE